jgi:hypothetical protein
MNWTRPPSYLERGQVRLPSFVPVSLSHLSHITHLEPLLQFTTHPVEKHHRHPEKHNSLGQSGQEATALGCSTTGAESLASEHSALTGPGDGTPQAERSPRDERWDPRWLNPDLLTFYNIIIYIGIHILGNFNFVLIIKSWSSKIANQNFK